MTSTTRPPHRVGVGDGASACERGVCDDWILATDAGGRRLAGIWLSGGVYQWVVGDLAVELGRLVACGVGRSISGIESTGMRGILNMGTHRLFVRSGEEKKLTDKTVVFKCGADAVAVGNVNGAPSIFGGIALRNKQTNHDLTHQTTAWVQCA